MKSEGVRIEYIQNGFPFNTEEFVVIFNGSKDKLDLNGWRLVYVDVASGGALHTHHFYKLRGGASFDPGERLCVISGNGTDRFQPDGAEPRFPGRHWDLYTDHPLPVLNTPWAAVYLFDGSGATVDSATVERQRGDEATTVLQPLMERPAGPTKSPMGFVAPSE
jgi:Lamin Tail Domain